MKKDRMEFVGELIFVIACIASIVFAFCWYFGRFFSDTKIVETILNTAFLTICCSGALLLFSAFLTVVRDGVKELCEYLKKRNAKGETS